MLVHTLSFGELEVNPQDVFVFVNGIPGFEDNQRYIIIKPDPAMEFCYIQSTEESSLAFLVCNPFLFHAGYDFQLSESNQGELKIVEDQDVAVWSIVTVDRKNNEVSLNLLAPIVVNVREKLGKQVILHDSDYQTKHKLSLPSSEQTAAAEEGL